MTARPVVVVPVYNAADALAACLDSLLRTLTPADRVLLADDASPDERIAGLLEDFRQRAGFVVDIVRRPRNLGFVGNVNAAFRETAPADVVLLNADTVTTPGWLDRLIACLAADSRIATATPWSNNAEICSWPTFCQAAPVPDDAELIAAAAATSGPPSYPQLPTGVGFCMIVRRAALDALGDFDQATFGRGYGEENDFCRRAAGHGWRNVLCDDAYVVHRGAASFGPAGHTPGGENLQRLCARYPDYNAEVADFILKDPLAPLRERLSLGYAALRDGPSRQQGLFSDI